MVNGLEELANNEWHGLDAFDLLLRSNEFPFEIRLFVFDIAFLEIDISR
jgi:hypothetical protein